MDKLKVFITSKFQKNCKTIHTTLTQFSSDYFSSSYRLYGVWAPYQHPVLTVQTACHPLICSGNSWPRDFQHAFLYHPVTETVFRVSVVTYTYQYLFLEIKHFAKPAEIVLCLNFGTNRLTSSTKVTSAKRDLFKTNPFPRTTFMLNVLVLHCCLFLFSETVRVWVQGKQRKLPTLWGILKNQHPGMLTLLYGPSPTCFGTTSFWDFFCNLEIDKK